MAITIDASSTFSSDPTNAQPVTYVGPVVSAPAGMLVVIVACCDAPPATPTSTITITAVSGGHTAFEILTINQASFGGANAPITAWSFTANGTPFQVTQQGQNGAQNSQAQAVYVLDGVNGIDSTGNFRGLGTPTINGVSPGNGYLALGGFVDSPNTLDTMSGSFSTLTDQAVVPDGDTVPSFFGHKFVNTGAFQFGVNALPNQGGTNGVMVVLEPVEEPGIDAVLDVTVPVFTVDFTAEATSSGVLDAVVPVPAADFTAEASSAGVLDVILPVPDGIFDGETVPQGVLNASLPAPAVSFTGFSDTIPQDTSVLPRAQDLLACLEIELLAYPNPPAQACLRAGDLVIHDVNGDISTDKICCPGLAYVRIGSKFPSSNFPNPDAEAVKRRNCLPTSYAVELVMGVVRCVPKMGTTAGPNCDDWTQAAITDANDLDAMTKALCCWAEGLNPGQLWLAGVSTVQLTADCIERQWTVLLQVPRCC